MVARWSTAASKMRQREDIVKAKANGMYHGAVPRIDHAKILALYKDGQGHSAIAQAIGFSRMQVYRVIKPHSP
jgi:DNA invertase Pin-like site-specific DNA recombinase